MYNISMDKDWNGNSVAWKKTSGFRNDAHNERQVNDYYATEPKATRCLLELDNFKEVWECACGGGHMALELLQGGVLVKATDKYDRGYYYGEDETLDFLEYKGDWSGDIVTNPPYKYASEFIKKGLSLLKEGRKLAIFVPVRYLSSKGRRQIFDEFPPYKVWVSSGRLNCAINGEFERCKGSPVDYCWIIWHKGYKGETKLGWFN